MRTNNTSIEEPSQVQGQVIIDESGSSFSGATVYVRLEDVSRADAPAQVMSEQVLEDISHQAGTITRLHFAMEGLAPDETSRYSVRVHVDVDGDGEVGLGDFLSVESYPVLTFGHSNQVAVRVRELK